MVTRSRRYDPHVSQEAFTDYVPISFQLGLDTRLRGADQDESGAATELVNWMVSETGGLAPRLEWLTPGALGLPAPRTGVMIGYFGSAALYVLGLQQADGAHLYSSPDGAAWTPLEILASGTGHVFDVVTAFGRIFYTSDELTGIRSWDGAAAPGAIAGSPAGARTLEYHDGRIFAGGSSVAGKSAYLFFSDVGDGLTWNPASFIPIRPEDGEPIECISSHDGLLVIGKPSSVWVLSGSGIADFRVDRLDGGGAQRGRSMVSTPYGLLGFDQSQPWAWRGAAITPLDGRLAHQFYGTGYGMTAAFDGYRKLLCAQFFPPGLDVREAGQLWAYDVITETWAEEHVGAEADFALNRPRVLGRNPVSATVLGVPDKSSAFGMLTRKADGVAESPQGGIDGVSGVRFHASSPRVWVGQGMRPFTLRHLFARVQQLGIGASPLRFTLTCYDAAGQLMGPAETQEIAPLSVSRQSIRERLDFGTYSGAWSVKLELEHTTGAAADNLWQVNSLLAQAEVAGQR